LLATIGLRPITTSKSKPMREGVVARRRLPEGLAGITMLHELIAEHLDPAAEPDQVLIGIIAEMITAATRFTGTANPEAYGKTVT
jgi:hypothetical protein